MNVANDTGAVVWWYDYDAFGVERNPDAEDSNPFRYCGEYWDVKTGTLYLRARYYDPRIGRFTQQDNRKYSKQNDPLTLNLYTYCGNNPVVRMDPTGHAWYFLWIDDIATEAWNGLKYNTDKMFDDPSFSNIVNWLTLGITDGVGNMLQTNYDRGQTAFQSGKVYDYGNWLSSGAFDTVKGTFNPKEPMSYQHFKDSLGTFMMAAPIIKTGSNLITDASIARMNQSSFVGFGSYNEFKSVYGPAGKNMQWHHIVEQNQIKNSGFSPYAVYSTKNTIAIHDFSHRLISAHYSSKIEGLTGGLTVRQWLNGKSFDFQYNYGLDVLRKYGVIK